MDAILKNMHVAPLTYLSIFQHCLLPPQLSIITFCQLVEHSQKMRIVKKR